MIICFKIIFSFKNKFLNFSETKKFNTENFLTFRELQPLVSYKRFSCKKNTSITDITKNLIIIDELTILIDYISIFISILAYLPITVFPVRSATITYLISKP